MDETIRGQILDTAKDLTTGDRNKSYGPPIENLTTYANLCEAYLYGKGKDNVLDAVDGAIFMVLAKISRIAANRGHRDNYVDGAAYMAIAGECDEMLNNPPEPKPLSYEDWRGMYDNSSLTYGEWQALHPSGAFKNSYK